MNTWIKSGINVAVVVSVVLGTGWAIRHFQRPGQLDVITAQAMDMSQMRPPVGAAPVALASVRSGSLANTVTYTGSILAYNEQDISPRITGTLVSLPVYPGDFVRAGQLVAQLDTSQVGPQAAQAAAEARQARIGAQVAHLTHHLHHRAALTQASDQVEITQQGVSTAQAEAQADQSAVAEMQSGVTSAQAQADYWETEIVREKQLADAGAVSQQEYQNELSLSQGAGAALAQAKAKVSQAAATAQSARTKVQMARRQVNAAQAGVQMAQADIAVAEGQALQAEAGASAASAAAQAAAFQQGYSRMTSPFGGVVTARLVAPGTLVQPGTLVLKIAQIDQVRVQANVAAEDMAGTQIGTPVTVIVPGDSSVKPIAARVTSVFPSASDQTRTAVVEAVIPNPGRRLRPGAFVTMQISKAGVTDKLLVPASAVVSENGQSSVWTVGGAAASQVYECSICHMHYSAADAKKHHYVDPMDGGKLVPVKAADSELTSGLTAHRVSVQVGATNGMLTEVTSEALDAGTRVVSHGQAGLTDGAQVVVTAWGADGPQSLPSAASAGSGQTVYRCEKCGMTYSAADAKKHHYVDPMDGGKLNPVPPFSAPRA